MIAILLVALFALAALATLASLADSAVRARNAFGLIKLDMARQAAELTAPPAQIVRLRPAEQSQRVSRAVPLVPQAFAA